VRGLVAKRKLPSLYWQGAAGGAAGARAVEALHEDAQYWRRLWSPELSGRVIGLGLGLGLGLERPEVPCSRIDARSASSRVSLSSNGALLARASDVGESTDSSGQSRRQYCASSSASTARAPAAPSRALPIERRQLSFGN
jgi:hypothetical protein